MKKYNKKLGGHKPNPVKPHKSVVRPKQVIRKYKTTQVELPLFNPKTN